MHLVFLLRFIVLPYFLLFAIILAALYQGKALYALGKNNEALEFVKSFLAQTSVALDIVVVQELSTLLTVLLSSPSGSSTIQSVNSVTASESNLSIVPVKASRISIESSASHYPVPPRDDKDDESALQHAARMLDTDSVSGQDAIEKQSVNSEDKTATTTEAGINKMESPVSSLHEDEGNQSPGQPPTQMIPAGSNTKQESVRKNQRIRKSLQEFHSKNIGSTVKYPVQLAHVYAMKMNLPTLSKDTLLDELICFCYININSGNHQIATAIFKLLLSYQPDLPSALIGLGSICAMAHEFGEAINYFSEAVSFDPTIPDAWKRLGQTRAAHGQAERAIQDLTRAVSLSSDPDILYARGLVFHQMKNYGAALNDFVTALGLGMRTSLLYNYIGMCQVHTYFR